MRVFTFFWIITIISILIIAGLGVETVTVQLVGVGVGLLLIFLVALQKRKLTFPYAFILYLLFLIVFLGHSLSVSVDSKKSLEVFSLFLGGGLFWIASFNYKDELKPHFDKIIIALGLVFAGLYFLNKFFGNTALVRPWSLYLDYSAYRNHNNIGDLWAIVMTVVLYYFVKTPKNIFLWILSLFGCYLLFISQSRAAFVALAAGFLYLANSKDWFERYKKLFIVFWVTIIIFFLLTGVKKTTLFNRPYYIQALIGLIHNPQGVGVGNFDVISKDISNQFLGQSGFSSVVHNLPLEVLSGMGVLGIVFIYWLIKVFREIFVHQEERSIIYRAVFIALLVNFFFHSTYFIPTMLWMWFICLGLIQTQVRRK